jgi:hypothetical protein
MKNYERIISTIKEESPLFSMIQLGLKPEEIKEAVIESLESYFDNKNILEDFALEVLVPESINLIKLNQDRFFFEMFEKCLFTYHLAKSKDPQSCFKSCTHWQPSIIDSISKYWSILFLEVDKTNLETDEFLYECLRNIGGLIEGVIKPYLKVLLHQIRIANETKTSIEDIDSLDLGTIVNQLIKESKYANLFMFPPWNVKLSQWRNIAYHHKAKVEKDEIICWYGKTSNIVRIRLTQNELLQVLQSVFNVYKTIKLAYTLFFVDNIEEINKFPSSIEVRHEAIFLNFTIGLASQGFEIVQYKKNVDEAKLVVKDMSNQNPEQRRFHASQFLFSLWLLTKSKQMIVEYREKDNTPNFLVSVNSNICKKIYNQELEFLYLPKRMKMVDLKMNKNIPPMEDDK